MRNRATGTRTLRPVFVCVVAMAAGLAYADKPAPPLTVTARITATDPVAHTAAVEIVAKALVKVDSVDVRYELPDGAALVPGSEQSRRDASGRQTTLTLSVTLPPEPGQMIVKAEANGKGVKVAAGVALDLPAAEPKKVKREPKPDIVETKTGETLRIHKDQ